MGARIGNLTYLLHLGEMPVDEPLDDRVALHALQLEEATPDEQRERVRRFVYESIDGWRATGSIAVGRSHPGLRSLEIRSVRPNGFVTASMMRSVSVGSLLADLQVALEAEDAERLGVGSLDEVPMFSVDDEAPGADDLELPLPPGYVRMTEALLRRVAEEYLRETEPGKPPNAGDRMAKTFGRPPETVRTWVSRARKQGWLGAGIRGRAGAGPGPRLLGYRATEEAQLRARAAEEPGGRYLRRSVRPDEQGPGGTIIYDSIPVEGAIERSERHVDDWRAHVDALDAPSE